MRQGTLTLVTSAALLDELEELLHRRKAATILNRVGLDAALVMAEVHRLAEIVDAPPLVSRVSRDVDDDAVLAAALAGQPEMLVTGDTDLLVLGSHAGIPVVTPAAALERVAAACS